MLGKNIKSRRVNIGMTQSNLAELLGTRQKDVSAWEADKKTPSIYTVKTICEILQCSMDEIMSN